MENIKVVVVGHVDHGKSTLVGRLLHETGSLPEGKVEQIEQVCKKRGLDFEWAFVLDALRSERDQGITIDVARIHFKTEKREYMLLDAPGHKEFIKNMVTGAANADAAILTIDASEGVKEQTKRHSYLLNLIGVNQIIVTVNKIDKVENQEEVFHNISLEITKYLNDIGVNTNYLVIIPVSAKNGTNFTLSNKDSSWYKGKTLVEAIDDLKNPEEELNSKFVLPIQDVYKFDDRRIIAGTIKSGSVKLGDSLVSLPSAKKCIVNTIEKFNVPNAPLSAGKGEAIGLTFKEQIFTERGEFLVKEANDVFVGNKFSSNIFWLDDSPIKKGNKYKIKIDTSEHIVTVVDIENALDIETLSLNQNAESIEKHNVGKVVLQSKTNMVLEQNSRFVISNNYKIVAGGLIDVSANLKDDTVATNIFYVNHKITKQERNLANNHKSACLWFTGLSASGKSTLAMALEKELFKKGYNSYVLDGDNVRHGLCKDLGFSAKDRQENIRRVTEVSKLFTDAGIIVLSSFISPYAKDRELAKNIIGQEFYEIYVKCDIDICKQRDPKDLYKKAISGEIKQFTGVSDIYEEPQNPSIVVDTGKLSVEESVDLILNYIMPKIKG